jgi:hypothetical protein
MATTTQRKRKQLPPRPPMSQDEFLEWVDKPTAERTQLEAERLFDGPNCYRVCIPKDTAQPTVLIKAHDEDQAEARYRKLCGINATEWEIDVEQVKPGKRKARKPVKDDEDEEEEANAALAVG